MTPRLAALWLTLAVASPALAHPVATSLLQLDEAPGGRVTATWATDVRSDARSGEPRLVPPAGCELVARPAPEVRGGSVIRRATYACDAGLAGTTWRVDPAASDAMVRAELASGQPWLGRLEAGSVTVPAAPDISGAAVTARYLGLGVEHILLGVDHLLFVLALLLLVAPPGGPVPWRRLLATLTAFTVGHSVTLAATVLGAITLPSRPVEVLIAISILLTTAEVARRARVGARAATTSLSRWPWLVAGAFGLLHGFGFAGALREIGLPDDRIPLSLLSFNAGVEVGQIAFVAAVLLVLEAARRLRLPRPSGARLAAAYLMGCPAAFWTLDRLLRP